MDWLMDNLSPSSWISLWKTHPHLHVHPFTLSPQGSRSLAPLQRSSRTSDEYHYLITMVTFDSAEPKWVSSSSLHVLRIPGRESYNLINGGLHVLAQTFCAWLAAACVETSLCFSTLPPSFNDYFFLLVSFCDSVRQQTEPAQELDPDTLLLSMCATLGFWFSVCLGL